LFLMFLQLLVAIIPFSNCDYYFKLPSYGCECMGIKKQVFLGKSQCIGKIKKCYSYLDNPNVRNENFWDLYREDKYQKELEVSCENFPENLFEKQ
ncbi:hypothetical protein KKG82_04210, partial [Patescibacteria group bacterium]|nr:hypothetical protein [Patescibacteria group bacterium]